MSNVLPGPHHCIGAARTAADIVYRMLHARCITHGGALSVEDLERCYAEILDSFASGFDIFERRHSLCMEASCSTAEMPFARDRILATILRACGERAARQAFQTPVELLAEAWLRPFFNGFADHVRRQICIDADQRLSAAYVEASLAATGRITLADLLRHRIVQNVLRDCTRPFADQPIPPDVVGQVCASLNGLTGADALPIEIAEEATADFLSLLAREIAIRVPAGPHRQEAEIYSLTGHKKKEVIGY